MNATNFLNFVTTANLAGINAINKGLASQNQELVKLAQKASASVAAANKMAAAWKNAGAALRAAQAQRMNIGGAQGNQGRNALGQFMSPAATQQALNQAASFARRLRVLLAKGLTVPNALGGLTSSVKASVSTISGLFAGLHARILKALTWDNIGNSLKASAVVAANAIRTLITAAAQAAGAAIRKFIVGALNAARSAASMVGKTLGAIRGGLGNLGIAGALITIGGVKAGYTVDKALAKINTIARETKPNLDAIAYGLEKIAATTGTTFSDNADAYYDLLSAGLGVKNGVVDITTTMNLMQDASYLAVGGIGTMKDSLDFLTTALNAFRGPLTEEFGDPLKASTVITDAFAKSVELGKVTVAELAPVFSTAAPLAAQLGVNFREMAAILAVMTQQGFDAGESFTALRAGLIGTQRSSKRLMDAAVKDAKVMSVFKQYGVNTWLELIDVGGFQTFAATLREYSERTDVPLIKLLGRVEAVQAILGTTGSQAANYAYILDEITYSSGNAALQAQLFNDSLSAQINLFRNVNFAILDQLFRRPIIDPLKEFVRELNKLGLQILDFVHANQKLWDVLIPIFAVLTGLAALTKGANAIQNVFLRLGGPISGFAIGIGRIGTAIALIAGPILIAVVAFETLRKLVAYGVLPAKTFGLVLADIGVALSNIGRAAGAFVKGIQDVISAITSNLSPEVLYWRLTDIFARMGEIIGPAIDTAAAAVRLSVQDFISATVAFLEDGFRGKVEAIGKAVLEALQGAWDWLAPRARLALTQALALADVAITGLVEWAAGIANQIGLAIIDALPKVAAWEKLPVVLAGVLVTAVGMLSGLGLGKAVLVALFAGFAVKNLPLDRWLRDFVGWWEKNGPAMVDGILAVFASIGKALADAIPVVLGTAGEILAGVWDKIVANKDEILLKAQQIVGGILGAMRGLAEAIIPPLLKAAGEMIDWISQDVIPYIAGEVADFIDSVVRALVPLGDDGGELDDGLKKAGQQLITWITDRIPGALAALLDYAIAIENWIITVLVPRIAVAMLGVGAAILKGLWDGLLYALSNPGATVETIAKLLYAILVGAAIIKAALAAGAIISLAYTGAIALIQFTGPMILAATGAIGGFILRAIAGLLTTFLIPAAAAVASFLGQAVLAGATAIAAATGASVAAILAAAIIAALAALVIVGYVAIQIKTAITAQGKALEEQVKEFVEIATWQGLEDAQAAINKARHDLDIYFDLGFFTNDARASLDVMQADIDAKKLEIQRRLHQAPTGVTVPIDLSYPLSGDTPEAVGARIKELTDKFDITDTVTKFKEGTAALVEEWNNFPTKFKTLSEALAADLKADPKQFLTDTVTAFQTGYAQIAAAMTSGNATAIVRAQEMAATLTKMAVDTNAAYNAAGMIEPFLIDPITGAVTLASAASKSLSGAIITPVSAIPTAFDLAGAGATALPGTISAATPSAGTAAAGLANAVTSRIYPLSDLLPDSGAVAASGWVAGVQSQVGPAGTAAGNLSGAILPVLRTPGDVYQWGVNVGSSWIAGVQAAITVAKIIARLASIINALKGNSPPKEGPLREIDTWGYNIGSAWVDGIVAGLQSGPDRIASAVRSVGDSMTGAIGAASMGLSFSPSVNAVAVPAYAPSPTAGPASPATGQADPRGTERLLEKVASELTLQSRLMSRWSGSGPVSVDEVAARGLLKKLRREALVG